jgi:hypothetical protein
VGIIVAILAWKLFFSTSTGYQENSVPNLVKEIEKNLSLPKGSHHLTSYNRFYALGEGPDAGLIIGVFRHVISGEGEIHVVSYKSLPVIFDGGCNVLTMRYSQRERRVESIECNGES